MYDQPWSTARRHVQKINAVPQEITVWESEIHKAVHFLLSAQKQDGSLPTSADCLDGHYKTPCALLEVGQLRAATRLLDYVKQNQLQPDGDFRASDRKFDSDWHYDSYIYANCWLAIGAHRMLRLDLSFPAIRYVASLQDRQTGGFHHAPPKNDGTDHLNAMVTSWAGVALLTCGMLPEAIAAADFLINLFANQPEPDRYLYQLAQPGTGKVLTDTPPGSIAAEPKELYERVDRQTTGQRYFHPGIQAMFLARMYLATQEAKYLETARALIEFFCGCASDHLQHTSSGQAGAATAILFQITGEKTYRDLTIEIGNFLASIQLPDGSWTFSGMAPDDTPLSAKYDIAGEFIIWLKHYNAAVDRLS